NANNLFFVDRAGAARISAPTLLSLTFGVLFCDYDNDGALDTLVVNGHIEPEINEVKKEVTYAEPTQLFWNRGDGTFADVSAQVGDVFQRKIVGRGAACADLDGDGDLDFVITTNNGPPLLIRNDQQSGNDWLHVTLEGKDKNRSALGAVATLEV